MPDKVSITKSKLDSLANAVAAKTGEPLPLTIDQMKSAIANMEIDKGGSDVQPGGVDIPVFDLSLDSNHNLVSVTCNKTFIECFNAYMDEEHLLSAAICRVVNEEFSGFAIMALDLANLRDEEDEYTYLYYVGMSNAEPLFDIIYRSDGQISFNMPSEYGTS